MFLEALLILLSDIIIRGDPLLIDQRLTLKGSKAMNTQ